MKIHHYIFQSAEDDKYHTKITSFLGITKKECTVPTLQYYYIYSISLLICLTGQTVQKVQFFPNAGAVSYTHLDVYKRQV